MPEPRRQRRGGVDARRPAAARSVGTAALGAPSRPTARRPQSRPRLPQGLAAQRRWRPDPWRFPWRSSRSAGLATAWMAPSRQTRPTGIGGFIDIVADFAFYGAVVFAFACGTPRDGLPAAFLLLTFYVNGERVLADAAAAGCMTTELRGEEIDLLHRRARGGRRTIVAFVLMMTVACGVSASRLDLRLDVAGHGRLACAAGVAQLRLNRITASAACRRSAARSSACSSPSDSRSRPSGCRAPRAPRA